jgi:hypothetical protein
MNSGQQGVGVTIASLLPRNAAAIQRPLRICTDTSYCFLVTEKFVAKRLSGLPVVGSRYILHKLLRGSGLYLPIASNSQISLFPVR